jgi:hypothetical protein
MQVTGEGDDGRTSNWNFDLDNEDNEICNSMSHAEAMQSSCIPMLIFATNTAATGTAVTAAFSATNTTLKCGRHDVRR